MMNCPTIAPPPGVTAVRVARDAVAQVLDWRNLHRLVPGVGGPRPEPGAETSFYLPTRVGSMGPDDFRSHLDAHRERHAADWRNPGPAVLVSRTPHPDMAWWTITALTIQSPGSTPETFILVQATDERPFGT